MSALLQPEPDVVVSASGLRIAFGNRTVLDAADVDIPLPGEIVVGGRSGSGKTSLLLVLAGLVAPSGGTVEWPKLDPDESQRRRQIAMVFQAPSLIPELTAEENVCLPLRLRGWRRDAAAEAAAEALEHVELDAAHGRVLPSELSGGEQQRVSVARAIATRSRLLLADEPTGALDRASAGVVVDALRAAVRRDGSALVVATHDAELAAGFHAHAVVEDRRLRWLRS